MDKLQHIKNAFGSNVTRERGFTQQFIEDVNWLIEQAEKVDNYEKTLKFYANSEHYSYDSDGYVNIILDNGEKARETLRD